GFAQQIELSWKSFLCGPLRISAYLCVNEHFNAEGRRDTQRPQRKQSDLPLCKAIARFICWFWSDVKKFIDRIAVGREYFRHLYCGSRKRRNVPISLKA